MNEQDKLNEQQQAKPPEETTFTEEAAFVGIEKQPEKKRKKLR